MKLKKILLIDDSDIDNFITKSVLLKANVAESIHIETSAVSALEYLLKQTTNFPDIIFLDIRMPKMDGFEFLDECVNFPDHLKNNCTVIMLSSSIAIKDVERAKQYSSVKKYIIKPLTLSVLESVIREI